MRDKIEAYLKTKMPGMEVTDLVRMSGGVGEEEWSLSAQWVEGEKRVNKELVVKIHQAGGPLSIGGDQIVEANAMKCLEPTPIPVPKIHWVETDPKWLGQPFFVMDKVEGTHSTQEFVENPELRKEVTKHFVEILATLHTLDWEKLGLSFLGVPESAEDCAARELEKWSNIYRSDIVERQPLLEEEILWLKNNMPKHVERVSLLWGDAGPGNFLHKDGRITGLLDWELVHLGDPMDDLGWLIFKYGRLKEPLDREEFIRYYESVSGIKVNEDSIKYYKVMANVRIAVMSHTALRNYCAGTAPSLFTAMMGTLTLQTEQKEAAELIGI